MVTKIQLLRMSERELDALMKQLNISTLRNPLSRDEKIALIQLHGDRADEFLSGESNAPIM
ncbi:MAG TPA: hypothetical protein HA282_01200 [Nanoarchaeota archaeon]|nr:hypothetical protein [Candidatus Pacearchaeota archaeon]HIH17968.1 hypothetical protein [Nanoarchaeota archaeon]HIH33836.1 hypothetical protein [Nanoarchaeota archaeon]HIH50779.1 hypothetical protein [Nanoarchaeota archaeon]HIH65815.1 hypothetical protein [Nanoarchaeota archaeon]